MTDTVRYDILKYIKGLYEAATANPTPPPGKRFYGMDFSVVELGPLGDQDFRKLNAIGIVATTEKKSDLYPYKTCLLNVTIEYQITMNKGDPKPAVLAETYLGIVQQIMYDDGNLGGKVIKHDEVESDMDFMNYTDKAVFGAVTFTVHYRHSANNVYSPLPTA